MLLSVFSDASFDETYKVAGWAAWIKSKRGRFEGSGAFKISVENANEAELLAIANAVHLALQLTQPGDELLIQSDCVGAIDVYEGRSPGSETCANAVRLVTDWCKKAQVTIRFRHVKGHVALSKGKARHWVNNRCDVLARKAMRRAREAHPLRQADISKVVIDGLQASVKARGV